LQYGEVDSLKTSYSESLMYCDMILKATLLITSKHLLHTMKGDFFFYCCTSHADKIEISVHRDITYGAFHSRHIYLLPFEYHVWTTEFEIFFSFRL
jgi:hypothetical protein